MLTQLLEAFTTEIGEEQLVGAIVLCALERPIDDGIRDAQALDPYHKGTPAEWSHTFLIAGPFAGDQTPILDCTIRDPKTGGIDWSPDLLEVLRIGISRSGGIYSGLARDYDDPRVHPVAIKYLPSLTPDQRASIVTAGTALQSEGYHYDVPGLVRELLRLLTHISVPAGKRLLFCSGFCQKAYRAALGNQGDFTDKALDEDTTPDDLWFSPLGEGYRIR